MEYFLPEGVDRDEEEEIKDETEDNPRNHPQPAWTIGGGPHDVQDDLNQGVEDDETKVGHSEHGISISLESHYCQQNTGKR